MKMIFEALENNIKILDISVKNCKLHISFDETHFEDRMQGSCT